LEHGGILPAKARASNVSFRALIFLLQKSHWRIEAKRV
jgi:hypothetical protein